MARQAHTAVDLADQPHRAHQAHAPYDWAPEPAEPWKADAACRDRHDLFWPEYRGQSNFADARAICAACPVFADCRTWALDPKHRTRVRARRRHDRTPTAPRTQQGGDPWLRTQRPWASLSPGSLTPSGLQPRPTS